MSASSDRSAFDPSHPEQSVSRPESLNRLTDDSPASQPLGVPPPEVRNELQAPAQTLLSYPDSEAAEGTLLQSAGAQLVEVPTVEPPPGYEILEMLGRGGMGVVYRARHLRLNRSVALKMILTGAHAGPEQRERFCTEAEAIARLQHPYIVLIYDVGEHNGLPFLALEYGSGGTLEKRLHGTPLLPREATALVEKLAHGMQAAHAKGVIHRDLKPANVLLAEDGTPKITDFGLAKKLDESGQTASGVIMGTPSYMAPEQAGEMKKHLGPACDVYALGAILYECLTGRPPFKAATPLDTILQVINDEPVPLTQLNGRVPRELETICLKCLQKEPSKRYVSAAALADDLSRWQRGEPILARPLGTVQRGIKWVRRNPVVAGLTAAVAVTLLAGLSMSAYLAKQATDSARQASVEKRNAEQNATEANSRAEGERRERELARRNLYVAHMHLARAAWEDADIGRALGLLDLYRRPESGQADPRSFEWHYIDRLCHLELRALNLREGWVTLSPDGLRAAVKLEPGKLWVHPLGTGQVDQIISKKAARIDAVAFSPDGQRLATMAADNHCVTVWDTGTGKEVLTTPAGGAHGGRARAGRYCTLVFSPDRRWIASAEWNDMQRPERGEVIVWDAVTGAASFTVRGGPDSEDFKDVAFSADSKLLAAHSRSRIKLWEVAARREIRTIESPVTDSEFYGLAFSPDGQLLASGAADQTVKLWQASSGKEVLTLRGHRDKINVVAFTSDGKRLASGSDDSTVRVWDIESGREVLTLRGHKSAVTNVAFNPDGWRLTSVDRKGALKVWDSLMSHESYTLCGHRAVDLCLAFSSDGRLLATGDGDQTVKIWDVTKKRLFRTLREHPAWVRGVAFSPDGDRLAAWGDQGFLIIWDVSTGGELATLKGHEDVSHAIFSPDGHRLAIAEKRGGPVYVWDFVSRRAVWKRPERRGQRVDGASFNPDGQRLAFDVGSHVEVWDLLQDREVLALEKGYYGGVVYSPDGRHIASGGNDGTVVIWDAASGEERGKYKSFASEVTSLAFSADGLRLLSVHRGTAKLWDTITGQEVWSYKTGWNVALSPDCKRIAFQAGNRIAVLEGVPPTPEGKVQLEARGVVQYLFGKVKAEDRVREILRADVTICDAVRQEAIALTDYRQLEVDLIELNNASWEIVRQSDAKPDQYRRALKQAETVCRLGLVQGFTLNTLGVAQYRVGQYKEAVDTLSRADKINRGHSADLAFLAMAQHRIGQKEQAKATLVRLRQALSTAKGAKNNEGHAFLREAEALIESKTLKPGQ